jgi:heme-degrading monooxygenase HmoA
MVAIGGNLTLLIRLRIRAELGETRNWLKATGGGRAMALLMIMESPGATTDQYDKVNEIMGIRGDEDAPEGLVQHVAAKSDDGIVIVDVWESQEALDRFFEERLGAALEQAGMGSDAPPRRHEVHNRRTGKGAEPNLLILIDADGLTTDQYDQMAGQMPAHADGGSDGPWFAHNAAKGDGGVVVADVWDSPESFGQFAEAQIGPAAQEAGMGPIEPRMLPIHNLLTGRARVS